MSFLKGSRYVVRPDDVRRLMPARDDALPMYVVVQGGVVGKSGDTLTVRVKGKTAAKARLLDVFERFDFWQRAGDGAGDTRTVGAGDTDLPFHVRGLAEGGDLGHGA